MAVVPLVLASKLARCRPAFSSYAWDPNSRSSASPRRPTLATEPQSNPTPTQVKGDKGVTLSGAASGARDELIKAYHITPQDLLERWNVERRPILSDGASGGRHFDALVFGPSYFFMVKTDANLGEGSDRADAARSALGVGKPTFPDWLCEQMISKGASNHFMRLLCNSMVRVSTSDLVLDTHEIAETWDGAKMTLSKLTLASRQSLTFQVEYQEYSGAPITNLHNAWVQYADGVTKGHFQASDDNVTKRAIDYMSAAFLFVCGPDGRTIEFGCKWTGVFPTAAPWSAFEGAQQPGAAATVSVPYAASYVEPNEQVVFDDFNTISGASDVQVAVENGRWVLNFPDDQKV